MYVTWQPGFRPYPVNVRLHADGMAAHDYCQHVRRAVRIEHGDAYAADYMRRHMRCRSVPSVVAAAIAATCAAAAAVAGLIHLAEGE